tara:strand:+ start:6024 stop:6629 length:606 start_codon:yes stop_codon:yes gene_type:complete
MSTENNTTEESEVLRPDAIDASQPEPLTNKVQLPTRAYVCRIKKGEFKFSSKNNPMIVLVSELCKLTHVKEGDRAESITVAGKQYTIGGVELRPQYLTLTKEAVGRLFKLQQKLGVEQIVDPKNPQPTIDALVGKVVNATCGSKEYIKRESLTEEQVAAGMSPDEAEPIRYEDGNPVKGYSFELFEVLELSSAVVPEAGSM